MIITIDGPAGAGKSTVARRLAARLGFRFLDTGAMYRAVTWAAIDRGIDVHDHSAVADVAADLEIEFSDGRTFVAGKDVTAEIRGHDVTQCVSEVADNIKVRELMVMLQREIAADGDFVCEGRDQGTVVFPDAGCKFFLTASPGERARRRLEQLQENGAEANFEMILDQQQQRDQRDANRSLGQLRIADDAVKVVSDGKTLDQVLDECEDIARTVTDKT